MIPNKATLLELAERCEAATGPDRELDLAIAIAVLWYRPGIDPRLMKNQITRSLYIGDSPRYSASLDAGEQIIPVGWAYRVDVRPDGLDLPRGSDPKAALGMVYRGIGQGHVSNADTGPLALCAAALKARAASLEK